MRFCMVMNFDVSIHDLEDCCVFGRGEVEGSSLPGVGWSVCHTVPNSANLIFIIGLSVCLFVCALVRTCTGTGHQNETLTPQDPQQFPKPKYESATALQAHPSIGHPNSTKGQYRYAQLCHNTTALLSDEATSEVRPRSLRLS